MPDPQSRTRTRSRTRRFSACHRHPSEPVTGFCALCLRDRLAGLDTSAGPVEDQKVVATRRRTRGHGGVSSPELRRSKSVAAVKCEGLDGLGLDLRRRSCDVRARSTLSDLFVVDDSRKGSVRVESMNLGFSSVLETKEEDDDDDDDEIRVSDDVFVRNRGENRVCDDDNGEIRVCDDDNDEIRVSDDAFSRNRDEVKVFDEEEGDLKTMKEHIELELENKRRNFWDSASVFSRKLRKWRQKQKEKKQSRSINGGTDNDNNHNNRSKLGQFRDTQSEVADYGLGRRSCDTEPRFSIDANRMSVEDPRFSFDEHRASWDGYMVARTIPRLTPMLLPPVTRGAAMEALQIHSINEDGASAQSNSDSSTSNRGSSLSSMKSSSTKTIGLSGDDSKSASNARVSPANDVIFEGTKLVITERELKDWHLNSIKNNNLESVSNPPVSTITQANPSNGHKNATTSAWRKVCSLLGHHKKNPIDLQENQNRNTSTMNPRNITALHQEFVLDRNRSTRYSTSDLESGLLRLYLTPFRSSRRGKSAKSKGRNLSPSMATNGCS